MAELIDPFETKSDIVGEQRLFRFDNGYGASVIRNRISYGHAAGLFELAVLRFDDDGGYELTYDTPVTDDVIGHLDEDAVQEHLRQIRDLPSPPS